MSERMTVEEVLAAIHASRSMDDARTALTAYRQAILDEGLKEYQARVDGLVSAAETALAAIRRSLEYVTVRHEAELALALHNLDAALAAVRALRAVSPTPVEEGG